jgi:hypothetical protein
VQTTAETSAGVRTSLAYVRMEGEPVTPSAAAPESPELFIGVVSHARSRFAVSQGPRGLAAGLADRLGPTVTVQVNDADLHDPAVLPVDSRLIQQSLTAQLHLEDAWVAYLRAGRPASARTLAASTLRHGLRWWRRLRSPGPGPVTRLINIELSHLDLMRAGLASGAEWILILEDDAFAADLGDCAAGLEALLVDAPQSVAYVSISESFSNARLGIEHLLTPASADWGGSVHRSVLSASRPVTNTVCAVLYRRWFLVDLVPEFAAMPMTPVVPIDFRLNAALMRMHGRGRLGPGACWLVSPAPIDQMSMQSPSGGSTGPPR